MNPALALLGVVGAVALVRWCVREVSRVTSELDGVRAQPGLDPLDRKEMPKLKRDPVSGEYRPG
jgi:hypothetical protein